MSQTGFHVKPLAASLEETQNVLAIGYSRWLAKEMGWERQEDIKKYNTVSRDFTTDGWFRLVNQPQFYGEVSKGREYVIADDVCTQGGTLASLRGFIENKGGRVICMTTLATKNGAHFGISIEPKTISCLNERDGGEFAATCHEELGYDVESLTQAEGSFLTRCASIDALRKGISGARDE